MTKVLSSHVLWENPALEIHLSITTVISSKTVIQSQSLNISISNNKREALPKLFRSHHCGYRNAAFRPFLPGRICFRGHRGNRLPLSTPWVLPWLQKEAWPYGPVQDSDGQYLLQCSSLYTRSFVGLLLSLTSPSAHPCFLSLLFHVLISPEDFLHPTLFSASTSWEPQLWHHR